jgi:adenine-specific DNA-methyltransferase
MDDLFSHRLEESYIVQSTLEHRQKYAQFFTPYRIAQFMAAWVLGGDRKVQSILDPAVGLGVFIRAIREHLETSEISAKISPEISQVNIQGYELDPQILAIAQRELNNLGQPPNVQLDSKLDVQLNIQLLGKDYLFHDWEYKYDAIIGNPPYFRFQDFPDRHLALRELSDRLGIKLSGFTNIYALFLLKSIHQLKENGRCAYIIPSEFLNSNYGKVVKQYLLDHGSLRYIIIFNFQENIFDRAITTSSIFLFSHDHQNLPIEFINITAIENLDNLLQQINTYPNQQKTFTHKHLKAGIKWRSYYQETHTDKYQNLVDFSTYGKVSRGIATGANDYFLFSSEKIQELQISHQYFLTIVGRASQVANSIFTQQDFEQLVINNKSVFILNAKDLEDPQIKEYILWGERQGIHQKYLTSHRRPWYAIERRLPAPIWVSVFSRGGLKFIKNEAGVRNLTTFHCVYLNALGLANIDLLFAYLLTDVARNIFADQRREYGGGLEKFEPNDLNHSKVINLEIISPSATIEILSYYQKYRNSLEDSQQNSEALDRLNSIFIDIL